MILSKLLGPARSGQRRCVSSTTSRLRVQSELTHTGIQFRFSYRTSTQPSAKYAAATQSVHFLSTSSDTRINRRTNTQRLPYNPGKQTRISSHQIQHLMDESKGFLKIYNTMDAAHKEATMQELLLKWGPAIKNLNDGPSTLRQAVKYADSLANIYLDHCAASNSFSARSNASASTFVNPAIHGWAKIQRIDPNSGAVIEAENLLKRLIALYEATGDYFFRPRLHSFNGVLDAFSKSSSKDAADRARTWLQQMLNDPKCVSPDRISFNSVLNAYASRGDAMRATALFEDMKTQTSRGLQPDTYSYNMLMKAWQRSGSPEASTATLELLTEFKKTYKRQGKNNLFLRPNTSVYSIPISLANAETAHRLLDDMLDWHQREPQNGMQPKIWHYAMVMNAYAQESQPEMAEEIFFQMLRLTREGQNHIQPDKKTFCILINAWCKQGTPEAVERAEAILKEMETLFLEVGASTGERMNAYGYNSVMNAHVQIGGEGSAARVEELFHRMARLGREHQNPEMLPDKVSYATLMKAWIKERAPGYAGNVEQLLRQMSDAYEKDGITALKPDVVSYGCAIDAWSKSGEPDGVFRAEKLLREMERLAEKDNDAARPNIFCFNSIINAHSKAGNAERAESVLLWMEDSYRAGNHHAKLDAVSYTSCIDGWARCKTSEQDAVSSSQQLFDTMVGKYKEGQKDCKPSAATFTALMMVLANHKSPDIVRLATENLRVMQELDIELNEISYNALLHACSCATNDKEESLKLAITSFHTMKKNHIHVNSITYNSLLHVVHNLVEGVDGKQRALEDVFRKCKEDGMMNDVIISTMERFGLPTSMKHLADSKAGSNDESETLKP